VSVPVNRLTGPPHAEGARANYYDALAPDDDGVQDSAQQCEYLPTNTLLVSHKIEIASVKVHSDGRRQTYYRKKESKPVAVCFNVDTGSIECPATRTKMLRGEHKDAFLKAERTELDGLGSMGTFEYIHYTDLPKNGGVRIKILPTHWRYAVKSDRLKARLVIDGSRESKTDYASVIWPWNLFMDRSEMNSDNLARVYPAVLKAPHLAGPINGVGARGVISKRS
jgi:hypothetical protein